MASASLGSQSHRTGASRWACTAIPGIGRRGRASSRGSSFGSNTSPGTRSEDDLELVRNAMTWEANADRAWSPPQAAWPWDWLQPTTHTPSARTVFTVSVHSAATFGSWATKEYSSCRNIQPGTSRLGKIRSAPACAAIRARASRIAPISLGRARTLVLPMTAIRARAARAVEEFPFGSA
ncbi:hypothetical protein Ae406Ps2_6450 [Pseudonocardia sp. Ae406_Ps2]|nr:hypothetical protein Ae406Ps2_6450 [Pseudonocardia sp. Ae406_Ps2]